MFKIASNGIVTVNRGDSFELPVYLHTRDSIAPVKYSMQPQDNIYLGIMEPGQPFETAIVRKKLTGTEVIEQGNILFRFWPTDTACLLPGKYYYQVKLQTIDPSSGRKDVETVVEKTLFYIQE